MALLDEVPLRGSEADKVSYLEHRALCAEREADEAIATAKDGGALIFARLRRDDAAAMRRMIARQPR
ncbi:hypothetical protein POLEWNIK_00380 [Brevundimonas phage vB_BpoS-Polewnik]|nr:hypothetical protein POLEWNIK_00380 [Brevundimonas phage vB_BpoS-Polewnik]